MPVRMPTSIQVLPENRTYALVEGTTILAGAMQNGLPFTHACGGNARANHSDC